MLTSFLMALKALLHNRLQTMLTLCGMSIGVAMVVIVSGLGRGAQLQIEAQIESAGPTLITLTPGNFRPPRIAASGEQDSGGGEVSEGAVAGADLYFDEIMEDEAILDARQRMQAPRKDKSRSPPWPLGEGELSLLKEMADIRAVAGSLSGNVSVDPVTGIRARTARITGFGSAWPDMHGWKLLQGRLPDTDRNGNDHLLAVVDDQVAQNLWPDSTALDRQLFIGDVTLTVAAIIDDGESRTGPIIVPGIYVPLETARKLLHRHDLDVIKVRTTSVGKTTAVATEIKHSLRTLRELPENTIDDFTVVTQSVSAMPSMGMDPRLARAVHSNVVEFEQEAWEEMAMSLRKAGRTFTLLLTAAAAVSLLVGGIGVMNIMLVSVAARTREIGLRMALGARMHDVLRQFMAEAVTLAALGGLVGLILGYAGLLVARHGLQWSTSLSPAMLLIAVLMAALTGVIFGYGPARRAASLDPVVALKSE
jgi:putative ABC transport system permease protein